MTDWIDRRRHRNFPQNIALFYLLNNIRLCAIAVTRWRIVPDIGPIGDSNKKLSYCWETVRRESMPRIAEMDVEMTT